MGSADKRPEDSGGRFAWACTVALGICLVASCRSGQPVPVEVEASAEEFVGLDFAHGSRGMVVAPAIINGFEKARDSKLGVMVPGRVHRKFGWLPTTDGWYVGLQQTDHGGVRSGVMGCAICHAGKAAGVFVPGLANKNFDVAASSAQYQRLEWMLDAGRQADDPVVQEFNAGARQYIEATGDPQRANLTQGMVPTGLVFAWVFRSAGQAVPDELGPAAVKPPHLWGFAEKREAGLFWDGIGDGDALAWMIGTSLTAGQELEAVHALGGRIEEAAAMFAELQPPVYPFAIDRERAALGREVFEENCAQCHGSYRRRADGSPVYAQPRWIPIAKVGTDPERLDVKTSKLVAAANKHPLGEMLAVKHKGRGYFAPRLEGVWSRFPYLHNASVPSLAALLTEPGERPSVFSLVAAGERHRFDEAAVGLTVPREGSFADRRLRWQARTGERRVYDTSRPGHSAAGHRFGTQLPETEKAALIEYLKTL